MQSLEKCYTHSVQSKAKIILAISIFHNPFTPSFWFLFERHFKLNKGFAVRHKIEAPSCTPSYIKVPFSFPLLQTLTHYSRKAVIHETLNA